MGFGVYLRPEWVRSDVNDRGRQESTSPVPSIPVSRRPGALTGRHFPRITKRRRDFAIFSGASAISQTGSMSVAAAGPLLALAITGSPIAAGLVTAASVLPALLLQLPAGALVDRVDRRKVMWASQLVRTASAIGAFSCLALSCDSVIVLIVAALVDGSCSVFYEVAEIATVPDLVSKKSLNLAIGSNEAKLNASMLFGRPLGGALLAVAPMIPWLVAAGTSFLSLLALLLLRRPKLGGVSEKSKAGVRAAESAGRIPVVPARPGTGAAGEAADLPLRGVLALLMRDSFSRAVLTACVLANFLFQVIVLLQILLAEQEGLPSYLVGLLLACSGLGGIVGAVGSPLLLRRSFSVSVSFCALAWVLLAWIIAATNDPVIGLVMWGLCSVIGAHINVTFRAHQANAYPSELLGRVTGITRFLSVGAVGLGALSGGWIIHFMGTQGTSVLIGVAFSCIALFLLGVLHFATVRSALHALAVIVIALVVTAALRFVAALSDVVGAGRKIWSSARDTAVPASGTRSANADPVADPEIWHEPAVRGSAPVGNG